MVLLAFYVKSVTMISLLSFKQESGWVGFILEIQS